MVHSRIEKKEKGNKDQMNTHKRKYYTETENNTLSGGDFMDQTKINHHRKMSWL